MGEYPLVMMRTAWYRVELHSLNLRLGVLQVLVAVLMMAVIAPGTALPAQERPPNFIIVLTDDLGYGDIGPNGASLIATPNLDRMAAEGIVLTDFYSSANVCTPSRAGLLTGRYPARLGLVNDVARPTNDVRLLPDEITIAEALRERGYRTALIGKWHLGHQPGSRPNDQGFEHYWGVPWSNDMTPFPLEFQGATIEDPVDQTTLSERYIVQAERFLEEHSQEPFFVYLAHSMPHVPLFVSEDFAGKSRAGLYGDVIETLDWGMGRLFATLERLGLDDSTLVIFTSDNGPWWEGSPGALRDRKGASFEGGMRVPFIARWPGTLPAGRRNDAIAMNFDLFPTLLQLAGAAPPTDRPIDGRDLMPVLQGGPTSHDHLLLFDGDRVAAARSQRWKLVVESQYRSVVARIGSKDYYQAPGLLFDMAIDPGETYSFTRENPEVARDLRRRIDEGYAEIVGGNLEDLPVWIRR